MRGHARILGGGAYPWAAVSINCVYTLPEREIAKVKRVRVNYMSFIGR
jgi:hypothetical protein